jgi:hypothetical protein
MTTSKLKPCPFCGGKASPNWAGKIGCDNAASDYTLCSMAWCLPEKEWNHRVPSTEQPFDCRVGFEDWMSKGPNQRLGIEKDDIGCYENEITCFMWYGWKAAWLALQPDHEATRWQFSV